MGRSLLRAGLALVLGLTLVAGSLAPQIPASFGLGERTALAADAAVSTCTEAGFNAALSSAQSSGGGTITFDCTGTITFTSSKTINSSVTIIGNGNVIFDGNDNTRFFQVNSGGSLELIGLTLQNGSATYGGAINNSDGTLTITASTLSGNSATYGGAILNSDGTLTITASTLSDNSATFGGAVDNFDGTLTITASTLSGNSASYGGAIDNDGTLTIMASTLSGNSGGSGGVILNSDGTLTITASTLSGNSASYGGAINNSDGTLTITASTLSGNSATSGGAIDNLDGTVTLTASTLSGNSADSGGAIDNSIGTVTVSGSIIADSPEGGNCFGTITSQGSNLSDDASCGFSATGDIQNSAAVNLGALADNGGPTQTMLPGVGSDAIDAADCSLSSTEDQRGADRPDAPATTCDIGAVEVGATVPVQIFAAYNASGPIDEGNSATVDAVAYGPAGASLDYDFDCDNDSSYETQGSGTGSSGTASCTFADDGSFTVGVQVCDAADAGNCATDTTTVTVNNLNPTISSVTNDGPIDEGASATITVSASDPAGVNDPLQYEFDCDNSGGYEVGPQASNTTTCSFADDGSFTVPARVTDGDGGSATSSTIVTVNNVDPMISSVINDGPVDEGSPATITVTATDPAGVNDPLTYSFDCDNDTVYETAGVGNQGECTFDDNGSFTVGVQVTDGDGGTATDSTSVTVNNVVPGVTTIVVTPEPSVEGESVVVSATFIDPGTLDTHSCTVDYDDGDGPVAGTITQGAGSGTCTGPAHTYVDDNPTGTASDAYTVTVVVLDDDGDFSGNNVSHTVNNVAPVIEGVTTNGPAPQGQPVTVTVDASDVGINDVLSYSFDCDNNGSYEVGPQASNQADCSLDPEAATSTIGVKVEDDDTGVATESVAVGQTLTMCLSYTTGAVSVARSTGCPAGTIALTVPGPNTTTFCISNYTGGLRWAANGQCKSNERVHLVPGSGPLSYCQSLWTGQLRVPRLPGVCKSNELPGVIPG